jgi:3-oxoacyl-[acyl-carrier protein] reductase
MTVHPNSKNFTDKVALITGSSRGIGLAIANRLCQDGYRVVLNSSKEASLNEATQSLMKQYGETRIFGVQSDVSDESSVRQMFERIHSHWGRLDVLMNNAGISPRLNGEKPTVETTPAEHWLQTIAINLTGTFYTCKYALPMMKPQGWGRIINMSSQAGRMFTGFASAHYSASKAGIIGFSRVLAGEVGEFGITVNCISPGKIQTSMAASYAKAQEVEDIYRARTPLKRIGEVQDVVGAVSFLAGTESNFMTGSVIDVSGGFYMP